jgi:glucoamylase
MRSDVRGPTISGPRVRSRRLLMVGPLVVVALVLGGVQFHRSRNVVLPLLSATVVVGPDGHRSGVVRPGTDLFPGTRVVREPAPRSAALAQEQREWLARGTVPGAGGPYEEMVRSALLDIHTLMLDDGALVAGWPAHWRYVWPRDAAFVAVALARTGHADDAATVLEFLQRVQPEAGIFQARYRPDGTVPDHRGIQSDGTGWVLWATRELLDAVPAERRPALLARFRPMIDRSTAAALELTRGPGALPPRSQDYWEIHDDELSLGTAAPLALGLRAAADLQNRSGDAATSAAAGERAARLEATIRARFGADGYPRYLGGDESDAAVAFLLPPFTAGRAADPAVVAAWRAAATRMARPAGGLAPGVGWKNDGVSWTPQTSLFAWTAASIGDDASARSRLDWLAAHRTRYGSLPEKVLSNGHPAGPAPLTWTAAMTVLAVAALEPG